MSLTGHLTNNTGALARETPCSVEIFNRISDIDAQAWDDCGGGENPFTRHAHLLALEVSGSVGPATGMTPSHLILRDTSGEIVAAAPTYIKAHSNAEYGSDLGWSMAYERFSGPYYPKVQVEVPLGPFPGPRLLTRQGPGREARLKRLLSELINLTERLELSSLHIGYMTVAERNLAVEAGMLPDKGRHFVWEDDGYGDFEGYLGRMSRNRRSSIRRERRILRADGINVEWPRESPLTAETLDFLFDIYANTYGKYNENPPLNRRYFDEIFETMPENIVFNIAKRGGKNIGGLFSFHSPETLYAQHWGSPERINFLVFETTIYQSITYALMNGIKSIDYGVNGQYKIYRGILPRDTYHAHWFRNAEFGALVSGGLEKKSRMLEQERDKLMLSSPFRRSSGGTG